MWREESESERKERERARERKERRKDSENNKVIKNARLQDNEQLNNTISRFFLLDTPHISLSLFFSHILPFFLSLFWFSIKQPKRLLEIIGKKGFRGWVSIWVQGWEEKNTWTAYYISYFFLSFSSFFLFFAINLNMKFFYLFNFAPFCCFPSFGTEDKNFVVVKNEQKLKKDEENERVKEKEWSDKGRMEWKRKKWKRRKREWKEGRVREQKTGRKI